MSVKIVNYFDEPNKLVFLEQIKSSDWDAGQLMYELLRDNKFEQMCGKGSKLLLMVDGATIMSYCTYAELDDIQPTNLSPWLGFVYTYPKFRGQKCAARLLAYGEKLAAADGAEYVHISTGHIGLYEKYGYEFYKMLPNISGTESRIYRKKVSSNS